MKPRKNFALVQVSTTYNAAATSIVLSSGNGAKLPAPGSLGFYVTWWNFTDYPSPEDDPNVEIVLVTAVSTDTLTVTRGQDGTSASTKNTAGKTYKMVLAYSKATADEIELEMQNGSSKYAVDSGSANAVVISPTPAVTAYVAGQLFRVKVAASNTTSGVTLNVSSLGNKNVVGRNGAALIAGEIKLGDVCDFTYDGTNFQLTSKSFIAPFIQGQVFSYAADTGTAGAYAMAVSSAPSAYVTGMAFEFLAANTNTAAPTLNVSSIGAVTMLNSQGGALVAGDIVAGDIVRVVYNGTNFKCVNVKPRLNTANVPSNTPNVIMIGRSVGVNQTSAITRSGNTATYTRTAHGLSTGDWVQIKAATQTDYNIWAQITVTDADHFTYTVANNPTTPSTGTSNISWMAKGSRSIGMSLISDVTRTAAGRFTWTLLNTQADAFYGIFTGNASGTSVSASMVTSMSNVIPVTTTTFSFRYSDFTPTDSDPDRLCEFALLGIV